MAPQLCSSSSTNTKAPTETSSDNAADKAWRGGGWAQSRSHSAADAKNSESLDFFASSQVAFVDSINSSKGTRCNSGSWWSGSRCSKWSCVYNRTQTPGRTRPARPARCRADAREHQAVSSVGQAENNFSDPCRWCRTSLTRPQSTTHVTSGIVTELSATLVARTILRAYPWGTGAKAARWSSRGAFACSTTHKQWLNLRDAITRSANRRISPTPGKKTKTAPSSTSSSVSSQLSATSLLAEGKQPSTTASIAAITKS